MKVTELVSSLAAPVCERLGLELWDVEFVKEADGRHLRVYVDKEGGVAIDDCEALSRELDPILDEADPIQESYVFEVSSAGVERELKRPSDFERFMGHRAEVRLYQPYLGAKSHIGELTGYDGGDVTLKTPAGDVQFKKSQVAQVRLRITV